MTSRSISTRRRRQPSAAKTKTKTEPKVEKKTVVETAAERPPVAVEHRDATISVKTRDQLSALRGWLYKRSVVPAGHREDWLGAIDDVIARFDGNDASAIWLTPDGEWAEEPAAA